MILVEISQVAGLVYVVFFFPEFKSSYENMRMYGFFISRLLWKENLGVKVIVIISTIVNFQ